MQSDRTYAFFRDLYDLGIIQPFAWMNWEPAKDLAEFEDRLEVASQDYVHRLIITHVRLDRFAEGHFDEMVESGLFARVLQRLAKIRLGM